MGDQSSTSESRTFVTLKPSDRTSTASLGLGLDAGGTQTRWALADQQGRIVAEGHVAALHPAQAGHAIGKVAWQQGLQQLVEQLRATGCDWPVAVHAGLTGYGGQDSDIKPLLEDALRLPSARITLSLSLIHI